MACVRPFMRMMDNKSRWIHRLELGGWIGVAILFVILYLRIFTPLGGPFPDRTRGPLVGWKSSLYELGDLPDDEKAVVKALPTERMYE